jgi:hypothetical protein
MLETFGPTGALDKHSPRYYFVPHPMNGSLGSPIYNVGTARGSFFLAPFVLSHPVPNLRLA